MTEQAEQTEWRSGGPINRDVTMSRADADRLAASVNKINDANERLANENASLRDALDLVLAEQRPWWCDDCRHSKCVRARQATLDAERLLYGDETDREA